jgi:hypothetical protein
LEPSFAVLGTSHDFLKAHFKDQLKTFVELLLALGQQREVLGNTEAEERKGAFPH